jgi:hypothetical protein
MEPEEEENRVFLKDLVWRSGDARPSRPPGKEVGSPDWKNQGRCRVRFSGKTGSFKDSAGAQDPQGLAEVVGRLHGKVRVPQGLEDDEVSDLVEAHQILMKKS